jgi:hypothetical protein
MRRFQIAVLIAALASFVAALFFAGTNTGDVLWRVGVAVTLLDIVSIMLWPSCSQAGHQSTTAAN